MIIKKQYAAFPYDRNKLDEVKNDEISFTITDPLFLETLPFEIRGIIIPFSAKLKREKMQSEQSLIRQIKLLDDIVQELGNNSLLNDLLENTKKELEAIRRQELKGVILRSKANWIENGEKPSKYFCGLEKRNYINKTVTQVINHNGDQITDQKDILKEIKYFYNRLYRSRDDILTYINLNKALKDFDDPKLQNKEAIQLDGEITYKEALEVFKKHDK